MASDPTRTIGPYELFDVLGTGGMGEVYRGVAPNGSKVAVKLLKKHLTDHPEVRRRFTREARAAARLEHPHIVRLIDFGSDNGEFYIVSELVTGGSLASWRNVPPDGETLVDVTHQILRALGYAHARGVVHRDLKPENILLAFDEDGHPCAKVMDFGVVFFRDERDFDISGVEAVVGTPAYMAPEQGLALCDATPATDLYSLGVILFEFLTGGRPYSGKSAAGTVVAHYKDPIPPVDVRGGFEVSGDLEGFVHRLLAKDPSDRYLFAADARKDLDRVRIRGSLGPAADAPPIDGGASAHFDETLMRTVIRPIGAIMSEPEPSSAFRLFGLREPPFEGRDTMLAELKAAALDAVEEQRGGVTFVTGEMGLGKSRLLRHLRESVEERGLLQVWTGSYDGRPEGPDVGYRQALRRGLGVAGLNPAELRVRVGKLLKQDGVDDPWELEALCDLLLPDQGVLDPVLRTPEARFALVARVLRRASARRPVLLALDDVHLSDGESVRLLRWLLTAGEAGGSWYSVATFRPEYLAAESGFSRAMQAFRGQPHPWVEELAVERLDRAQLESIIASCVPVETAISDAVAMRAGGNPMVAVELLRHLVDSGRLEGFGQAPTAEDLLVGVPTGIGALVARRLDEAASAPGADERTAAVWEHLAFVGLRFDLDLAVAAVAPNPSDLASFDRAVDVGLLYGILLPAEDGALRFESGLMRDAIVERAAEAGRARALQSAVGDAKAAYYRDALPERAMEIARHYHLAGRRDDAIARYRDAVAHAWRHHAMERVLEAWQAIDALSDRAADADVRIECALGAAEAHLRLARLDDARQATARARGATPLPWAIRLEADIARIEGDLRGARTLYDEAIRVAGEDADLARARYGLGLLELRDGRLPIAESLLLQAREAFHELGDVEAESECTRALARTALATGLVDEARALAVEGRRACEGRGDRRGVALFDTVLGRVAYERERGDSARLRFEDAVRVLAQFGDRHAVADARVELGRAAMLDGAFDDARAALTTAESAYRDFGDAYGATLASLQLARLDAEAGSWNRAEPRVLAVLAHDADERIDDPTFTGGLVDLARAALFAGRADLARKLLETAAFKLDRVAEHSPLYDRVDEVQYLLAELGDASDLDEPGAVVDLFADEPSD